jgi:hypothetical protein
MAGGGAAGAVRGRLRRPAGFQAFSKSAQILPSRAKFPLSRSKEKAWISLDSLVRFEPFQWLALTPQALFSFSVRGGGQISRGLRNICACGGRRDFQPPPSTCGDCRTHAVHDERYPTRDSGFQEEIVEKSARVSRAPVRLNGQGFGVETTRPGLDPRVAMTPGAIVMPDAIVASTQARLLQALRPLVLLCHKHLR